MTWTTDELQAVAREHARIGFGPDDLVPASAHPALATPEGYLALLATVPDGTGVDGYVDALRRHVGGHALDEASGSLPEPAPAADVLRDDVIELRLLRVLGPEDAGRRRPEARFLAAATECRFAIHRREDGVRVGRIHLRLTGDPAIVRALGHSGYEVDDAHRRQGYATRALLAIRRVARHYGVAPLRVLIAPGNVASRRTAERAGLTLVDTVATAPEALALGIEPELCRYSAERP